MKQNKKKTTHILFASLVILFTLLSSCSAKQPTVSIDNNTILVEVAHTPEEMGRGLMFREHLNENAGMIFVYQDQAKRIFWMKNTLIPLDIIFIDENDTITKIHNASPCLSEPCTLYSGTAKYVLEVNEGYAKKYNIQEGDIVNINLT